jgi:2-(1,2-epoxy-1,2-dihydrophenyl)acetyl-CoA isomerase
MSTTEERSSQTTASSPASAPLETAREGGVLILTLNRPDRLNALTEELHSQLLDAVRGAACDETVAVLVLTGAGRAFCSGGDMGTRRPGSEHRPTLEERADELLRHSETVRLLHTMPKPTLAMVNGVAAGAGLALALACDLRIASREAVLTTSYIKVALSGDLGSSYFLTQLVGSAKARELLFLSEKLDAESALRMGLVSRVEEPGALREETLKLARQLAAGPSVALRYIKRNINCAETATLEQVLQSEALAMARCGRTQDVKEAASAFREKRPPVFKGY